MSGLLHMRSPLWLGGEPIFGRSLYFGTPYPVAPLAPCKLDSGLNTIKKRKPSKPLQPQGLFISSSLEVEAFSGDQMLDAGGCETMFS